MADNVIKFPFIKDEMTPRELFDQLQEDQVDKIDKVVIIGVNSDDEFVFAGSTVNLADINLLLDMAKEFLMDQLKDSGILDDAG